MFNFLFHLSYQKETIFFEILHFIIFNLNPVFVDFINGMIFKLNIKYVKILIIWVGGEGFKALPNMVC